MPPHELTSPVTHASHAGCSQCSRLWKEVCELTAEVRRWQDRAKSWDAEREELIGCLPGRIES